MKRKDRQVAIMNRKQIEARIESSLQPGTFIYSRAMYEFVDDLEETAGLMELVPAGKRSAWHERAMTVIEKASLDSAVDILLETGELDRLAARIDRASDEEIRRVNYQTMLDAAEGLSKPHPLSAARIYAQLGLHILLERKNKLYEVALIYFERARDLSTVSGAHGEWEKLVTEIRETHRRKTSFMKRFERIAGGGPAEEPGPSIIELAKKKWPRSRP